MKPIEIEICERLADYWIDESGNKNPKYHAQIKDQPGMWGCGRCPQDALGSLIRNHPALFGISIRQLGKLPR
jgi:hypothetical protein